MSEASERSAVVTGTSVKSNEGWTERAADLCDPELWEVEVRPSPELLGQLAGSELTRLQPKIEIVRKVASYMAAGMLKGTLKYPTDQYDLDTWMNHLLGEGADFLNYIGLTLRARESGR